MNELLALLADSKVSLTGHVRETGELICVCTDISDPTDANPIRSSFRQSENDECTSLKEFVFVYVRPACISIKRARNKEKIESLRAQANEILVSCESDEDLVRHASGLNDILVKIDELV